MTFLAELYLVIFVIIVNFYFFQILLLKCIFIGFSPIIFILGNL